MHLTKTIQVSSHVEAYSTNSQINKYNTYKPIKPKTILTKPPPNPDAAAAPDKPPAPASSSSIPSIHILLRSSPRAAAPQHKHDYSKAGPACPAVAVVVAVASVYVDTCTAAGTVAGSIGHGDYLRGVRACGRDDA